MKSPYPPSHPAYAFQKWNYSRVYDKVLSSRSDGSHCILFRDSKGMVIAAKEADADELRQLQVGVAVVVSSDVAVRKRTRRS